MIFSQLAQLASKSLSMTVTVDEKSGDMTVMVIPQGEGALTTPLVLTATPAELDAGFVQALSSYGSTRKSLAEQLAEAEKAMKEAGKQATVAAAKKASKSTTPAITVKSVNDDDDDQGDGDDQVADLDVSTTQSKPQAAVSEDPMAKLFD